VAGSAETARPTARAAAARTRTNWLKGLMN
jgi:hypothetical protein